MQTLIPRVVLFSGGMDSTAALAWSAERGPVAAALSVNYGQRHSVEIERAKEIAALYNVPHLVLDMTSWGSLLSGSALTDSSVEVPDGHYAEDNMAVTVVPNRNATMLMAAVGVAESLGAQSVVTAVHAGDHTVYADCRPEFITSAAQTALQGTDGRVTIEAPFVHLSKADIAKVGSKLNAPFHLSWSCYKGGETQCGTCGTCVERIEAFELANVTDPTEYLSGANA